MAQTPIVVVSGLPRSGTSLMMQMLDAGGFPVLTDAERLPDESNPRGYYEYAPVKRMHSGDTGWLADARGKAVKIVSALLPLLPAVYPYRIIFMQRDLEEVVQSQQAMRARLGSANGAADADRLLEDTARHVQAIEKWLSAQARLSVLFVGYADVLADAAGSARQVADFIEAPLDIPAMVRAVDPSLWRERGNG
jgi:Sulfotransferase domain